MLARRRVRHDWRRLEALVRDLPAGPAGGPGRSLDQHLHQVRKAAKRVRYAAETAQPVSGPSMQRLREEAARFQETLGAHQDALVLEEYAGRLGRQAAREGEATGTYEVVARVAATEAERLAAGFPALWERLELSRRPRRGLAGR